MKRGFLFTAILTLVMILSPLPLLGAPVVGAQSPSSLLPPVSITLTPIPSHLPPGGSGVVIVQLADVNGNPSPARSDVAVNLFSSDPGIASVSQQVTIPFGKSHAEAEVKAGVEGAAT